MNKATRPWERRVLLILLIVCFGALPAIALYSLLGGKNIEVIRATLLAFLISFSATVAINLWVNAKAGGAAYSFGRWTTVKTNPVRYWLGYSLVVLFGVIAPLAVAVYLYFAKTHE